MRDQSTRFFGKNGFLNRISLGAAVLAGFALFPFLVATLTGPSVGEGRSQVWRSLLIPASFWGAFS